jgi:nitroreductase
VSACGPRSHDLEPPHIGTPKLTAVRALASGGPASAATGLDFRCVGDLRDGERSSPPHDTNRTEPPKHPKKKAPDMDLDKLMSKHLTRYFDPNKTIPEETVQQLLKFLRSAPTSTNIQPNHFYVLATDEGKERLAANLGERFQDNAEKIMNSSHTIIVTTRADLPESHLEAVFAKERADGRFPEPGKHDLWESMTRDFLGLRSYGYKDVNHWMEKQTYMVVGLTMMAAAELGVEATPLEGFDPTSVDKAFKIRETGHSTTVLLALGYPDPQKQYSNPISRFDEDQLFTFA